MRSLVTLHLSLSRCRLEHLSGNGECDTVHQLVNSNLNQKTNQFCEPCKKSKMMRLPTAKKSNCVVKRVLQQFNFESAQAEITLRSRKWGFALLADSYSQHRVICCFRLKSETSDKIA